MEIIYISIASLFLCLTILFLTLFIINRKKVTKLKSIIKNKDNVIVSRNAAIQEFKSILATNRQGYYDENINLTDSETNTSKPYTVYVYVKEIERYTNGMSKIQLIKSEVVSGYSPNQYLWVKECVEKRFSSVKKSSEIEWLEVEEDLKEMRKEKLNKILNKDKDETK